MKTKLLYLDDSYLREMNALILEVIPEGEGKYRLLLDQTVFYAMGGGQPTDQGKLTSSNWLGEVYQVITIDGELWHYLKSDNAPINGDVVHGVIDWERRYKNMRYHTGGHIVDFALYLLGYSPDRLTPIKADHGKKPYIVYKGLVDHDITQELQNKVDELIEKDLQFSWDFQSFEDLKKEAIYLQPNLPTNKPLRTLRLETVGAVADGGTQLHSTSEAGKIMVGDIDTEEDSTIIHYLLPQQI